MVSGLGPRGQPVFRSNLAGKTGWFAAPVVADLDGDGSNELIAAYYDLSVYDANTQKVADIVGGEGRVYAPHVEVIATYNNHHIQACDPDGVAINASPWFTNRDSTFEGERLTWGQFIRWADPQAEADHYHSHTGEWPHPGWTEWLQWTASPPTSWASSNHRPCD